MNLTIDGQPRKQHDRTGWIDCNDHGEPHQWVREPVPHYFRCERCPVVTKSYTPLNGYLR
jgi:hypothetical protein